MLDIKFVRENRELVKENIKKKFQDSKLPLVDEVIELDSKYREAKLKGDELRKQRNDISGMIGALMREGKKEEAMAKKEEVTQINEELVTLEADEALYEERIREIMLRIPNIIADDVPIGEDDSKNVEEFVFGEPVVPSYEIPYH